MDHPKSSVSNSLFGNPFSLVGRWLSDFVLFYAFASVVCSSGVRCVLYSGFCVFAYVVCSSSCYHLMRKLS